MEQQSQKPTRWLTAKQVAEKTGFSRNRVYELPREMDGFPKPIQLGQGAGAGKVLRWVESEIEDWMKTREAKRA